MNTKIVEALTKILENLGNGFTKENWTVKIKNIEGFDEQTLSVAYSFIFEKLLKRKNFLQENEIYKNSFRVLSNEEIEVIGAENYKYIQHLVNIGLLTPMDVNLLAEQVTAFPEERISKDDINWIILFSMLDLDIDVLPGSRVLLYSSDTIN